jgi:hypothetical protein
VRNSTHHGVPELSSVLSRRATRAQQRLRPRVRFRYERDTFRARRSIRRTHTASRVLRTRCPSSLLNPSRPGASVLCLWRHIHARCTPLRASCPFALAHSVHCLLDLNLHPHCPTFVLQQVHCCRRPSLAAGAVACLSAASLHALTRGDRLNDLTAMHASEKAAYNARLPVQTADA